MAEFAKVDEASVRYSFEHDLIGVATTYVPDVDGIVATVKIAQELGFAPKGVDLPTFARRFNEHQFCQGGARAAREPPPLDRTSVPGRWASAVSPGPSPSGW